MRTRFHSRRIRLTPPSGGLRQAGMTLIEVMVALIIGLFIILAVTQLYINSRSSQLYRDSLSQNMSNTRFLEMRFEQELGRAGYRRTLQTTRGPNGENTGPYMTMERAFPALTSGNCSFPAGETVQRVSATSICIRFQPRDTAEVNCTGDTAGNTALATPYSVTSDVFVEQLSLSSGVLTCATPNTGKTVNLIDGITSIYFDYGVATLGDDQPASLTYTATPDANTQSIRSVRYALLMSGDASANQARGIASTACTEWNALTNSTTANSACTSSSTRIYRVATGAMAVRNLLP